MKKPMSGTGSTLVILVFTVLCLTIFMLVSLSTARVNKALSDTEARLVAGYYEADLLAECILAEMAEALTVEAVEIPANIRGINILYEDSEASFSCPISDNKELYVKASVSVNSYKILEWRMRDTDEWITDSGLPVWSGD